MSLFAPKRFTTVILAALAALVVLSLSVQLQEVQQEEKGETDGGKVIAVPSSKGISSTFGLTLVATLSGLASVFWQHVASVAVATNTRNMTYGTVESEIGFKAMAFGWAAVVCLGVAVAGLWVQLIIIRGFERLARDSDS